MKINDLLPDSQMSGCEDRVDKFCIFAFGISFDIFCKDTSNDFSIDNDIYVTH